MKNLITIALKYYNTNPGNWNYPWCAAFLNYILKEANQATTTDLMARSFLNYGNHTDKPKQGDIVILWRISKDGPWGHCGLYVKESKYTLWLLSGNSDGTVKIKRYPKWQLLDIRTINV